MLELYIMERLWAWFVVFARGMAALIVFPFSLTLKLFQDERGEIKLLKEKRYFLFALVSPLLAICYAVCWIFTSLVEKG